MAPIKKLIATEIYDSRGNPTVQVDLYTDKGKFTSMVPSGASTGSHEAVELRDNDPKKHGGKGVHKACANVNEIIAPKLINDGIDVCNQLAIDKYMIELDGTPNKAKLGANAILGVSMAATKAAAADKGLPLYAYLRTLVEAQMPNQAKLHPLILPIPSFNVVNGGKHSGNQLAPQEFMILPVGAANFIEAMRMGSETYHILRGILVKNFGLGSTGVGDEGGFAPEISDSEEVLRLLVESIDKAGYTGKIKIGMDPASSEFFKDGKYNLRFKSPKPDNSHILTGDQMIEFYSKLIKEFPIIFIEDPFAEDDWNDWSKFYQQVGDRFTLVGDDLTVTNPQRIKMAIERKACNCLLLKVNQIGTITESLAACNLAYENGWTVLVSHRSGETEDSFIADLVVALGAGKIKTGAPCRSERLAKYNRMINIEKELGNKSDYAGKHFNNYFHTKL